MAQEVSFELRLHAARFGVTRVGRITELDRSGVEVVVSVRSDVIGESITTCSGKGWTVEEATAGALGEALERFAAEPRARIATFTARRTDLWAAIDPRELIVDEVVELDETAVLEWVRGVTLCGRDEVHVPANAVFFPYEASPGRTELFAAQTTGLAVGCSFEEAALRGLLECIERDALSVTAAKVGAGLGASIPGVQLEHATGRLKEATARLVRAGIRVLARDFTTDVGVPTVGVTLVDADLTVSHFGAASALTMAHAAEHAFLEAAQSRVVWIQGAREDLSQTSDPVHPFFVSEPSCWSSFEVSCCEGPTDAAEMLEDLAGRAARVFGHEPVAVDISLDGVGCKALRVISPGAEVWAIDRHRAGRRVLPWLRGA